ncbi:MAG: hypothetical protein PSV22_22805 [Pseudolabrys sp.]|nr:hypothetical protein [Pseudolabrys sp.]
MSREAAKKIVELIVKQGAEQNQILLDIESTCSKEEFARYRRMIGKSMRSMLLDVLNPIVRTYPDLRPPQLEINK